MKKLKKEIILGVTGSIAAYKSCDLINRLKEQNLNVTVVMTADAKNFITPLTLQSLSANKVYCDLFALPENVNPVHISLAEKCDLLLILPATANILAKLAAGLADDTLTCLALSVRVPIVLCCAMNEKMFTHKITQRNISSLREAGYYFIGPEKGRLVCGGDGLGHLADISEVVGKVVEILE